MASLESAAEQRIQSDQERLTKGYAFICIAHRLSMTRDTDKAVGFKAVIVVE